VIDFNTDRDNFLKDQNSTTTGWWGTVYKTVDAGKTFTKVLDTPDDAYYYFNSISCASENSCVVVGEGYNADGSYLTVAFTTVDGGKEWKLTHSTSDVSMIAASCSGGNTCRIGGTKKDGRHVYGQFYLSLDGGLSWELEQSLDNCLILDMDFPYATCSSSSGSSAMVAQYI
jgi:hypothetical protein